MSTRPAPLDNGDQRHIPDGTLRRSVARGMRLLASLLATPGTPVNTQYAALLAGADVVLTSDQVRSFVGPSRWPATLDAHARWILRGNDELVAIEDER